METLDATTWSADWTLGLPLIVLNVVIHVFGLAFIYDMSLLVMHGVTIRRRLMARFAQVMTASVLMMIVLHALEAGVWALV